MNLRDALIAGSAHGIDRLSVDADRRLRRRLGLESARAAAPRRAWVWPALGALAVAALILVYIQTRPTGEHPRIAAAGFVDASAEHWDGSLSADALDVRASSPASATVSWRDASITAAPGTNLTARADGDLVLAAGSIQIARTDARPMAVRVPVGRAVFASYRSHVRASVDSVTIVLEDGSGEFTDATGHTHALVPATPFVLPLPTHIDQAPSAPADAAVSPSVPPRPIPRALPPAPADPESAPSGPPGVTPPRRRPDTPCTYKSDCDPGATCRKNEDGDSVCMGNGDEGAACWFDSDCLSKTCVSGRCAASAGDLDRAR